MSIRDAVPREPISAQLVNRGWLYRALEVRTPEAVYRVTYSGRGLGYESVSVNGKLVAAKASGIWFTPEFSFPLGSRQALVKVSVWAWMAIRSFELVVDGVSIHSE